MAPNVVKNNYYLGTLNEEGIFIGLTPVDGSHGQVVSRGADAVGGREDPIRSDQRSGAEPA